MELASPVAIAYWSALNHHGLTEQLPRAVFIATNHPVRRPPKQVLGVNYTLISRPMICFMLLAGKVPGSGQFMLTERCRG